MNSSLRVNFARGVVLLAGFFLLSYGSIMGIEASLGVSSWQVLHLGLAQQLHSTVGRTSQYVGIAVLLLAMLLGVRPGLGMWLNILLVGYFMDFIIAFNMVPHVSGLSMQVLYMLSGLVISGLGVAGYICANMGAGPRDSLMLGLHKKTGLRIAVIRPAIEVSVVVAGYFLGGPVGIGTVVGALLTGAIVERWLMLIVWLSRYPALAEIMRLPDSIKLGHNKAVSNDT
jgi:uncharacterized protein